MESRNLKLNYKYFEYLCNPQFVLRKEKRRNFNCKRIQPFLQSVICIEECIKLIRKGILSVFYNLQSTLWKEDCIRVMSICKGGQIEGGYLSCKGIDGS